MDSNNRSAAFYIGTGENARMIAWLPSRGAPYDLEGWPLLGAVVEPYTEREFYSYARERADITADSKFARSDEDLLAMAIPEPPRWQYCYVAGSVHVLDRGFFLAQVFPHGGRRQQTLPGVTT